MSLRTDLPVRHASLATGAPVLDGLRLGPGGVLELLQVPAFAVPSIAPPAAGMAVSGVALDRHCGLYVSDARHERIVRIALDCGARAELEDAQRLKAPAGLCTGPQGRLYAVDPGLAIVVVIEPDGMTVLDTWGGRLDRPLAIASGERTLYVADAGAGEIVCFDPAGQLTERLGGLDQPSAVAVGPDGVIYVGNTGSGAVRRFAAGGGGDGPDVAEGTLPRALAVHGDVLYVGDAESGEIRLFATGDGRELGRVEGFQGPVSALEVDRRGRVYIKTGDDEQVVIAEPGTGHVPRGTVTVGPFDAGEQNGWRRAVVDGVAPAGTRLSLATSGGSDPHVPAEWSTAAATDTRLPEPRYLWLRVTLERDPDLPALTPQVHAVRALTAGDSYLDHLPAVYSGAGDFVAALLALVQSELGDLEATIGRLPRRIDPRTASPRELAGLAAWQALDVPDALADLGRAAALRGLLGEIPSLYRYRATCAGVARFAQIYAGVRPRFVEDFRARPTWLLDGEAPLGVDTGLLTEAPDGLVVGEGALGESGPEDPETWGAALFEPTAHRFVVLVPAAAVPDEARLREVLDAEKPAHTTYELCVAAPRLRVGVQATLGVDAIVAGPIAGMRLDEGARLGVESWTQEEAAT